MLINDALLMNNFAKIGCFFARVTKMYSHNGVTLYW